MEVRLSLSVRSSGETIERKHSTVSGRYQDRNPRRPQINCHLYHTFLLLLPGGSPLPNAGLRTGDGRFLQRSQPGSDQQPAAGGSCRARGAGGAVGASGNRAARAGGARGRHGGLRRAFQVPHRAGDTIDTPGFFVLQGPFIVSFNSTLTL